MKAVFLMKECVLPGRAVDVTGEATRAGLRALAQTELFIVLLDTGSDTPAPSPGLAARWVSAIEAVGGRIDAVVSCPHPPGSGCTCWNGRPGLIFEAASRFDLTTNECYLIGTAGADAEMAMLAGVRPVLLLQGRSVGEIIGDRSAHKDYPIARSLDRGVEYILTEERTAAQLGRPRQITPPAPIEEGTRGAVGSPVVTPISRVAVASSRRLRPREAVRWLTFFILGGVWLSLGIAYLLTHLYRVQPFPDVVYYITLQFIPRVVRGVLFILTGVAVVLLASWSFFHAFGNGRVARRR